MEIRAWKKSYFYWAGSSLKDSILIHDLIYGISWLIRRTAGMMMYAKLAELYVRYHYK